jgi:DNA polymerase
MSLDEIAREISNCRKCQLWSTKTRYVPGEGSDKAEVVFVGEAPGREEDRQGRPFVGNAGKLLTEMIEKVLGLSRKDVFIANVLKCRPPNNRDPLPEEIDACSPYLIRQLEMIQPRIIVCLGRFSANFIFELLNIPFSGISKVRGKVFDAEMNGRKVKVIATYHPAAILYKPQLREIFEGDFRTIASLLKDRKTNPTLLDFVD